MRKLIFILLLIAMPCYGQVIISDVTRVEGTVLHSIQSAWEIVDYETSAGTEASALAVTERTKQTVDAAIDAGSSGDDEISTYVIPAKWNAIRLRCIGITDACSVTHNIYLGTLGGNEDCELTYAGELAWTIGTQQSIYDEITFTSGGPYVPQVGDTVTGNTSTETATIAWVSPLTSGTWADANAAGTVTYTSASGVFSNSETVTVVDRLNRTRTADGYTHAASDLFDFELADTLTATAKAWGSSWTATSPADNTNAEAEIDIKGADYMVVVTSTCTANAFLLIKGY